MTESHLVDGYLALTRQALTPSLALRDRVQARLDAAALPLGESGAPGATQGAGALTSGAGGALLGAGLRLPGGAAPGAMLAPVAATSHAARGNVGALLGGGLLVLGFLSGYWARGIDGQPPPLRSAVAAVQEEQLNEELVPEEPALPQLDRAQRPPPSASSRSSNAARPATATRLPATLLGGSGSSATREELLLLQRTERAVRAGNSALALMLLGELEAGYPRSELLEERRALELLAYCVAHASDSVQRSERFLRQHPRSVYAERISALCQVEAPATQP